MRVVPSVPTQTGVLWQTSVPAQTSRLVSVVVPLAINAAKRHDCAFFFPPLEFCIILTTRMWASDFAFKADLFAREYGDVNPGIPFWPEGGDTANLSASLRPPFQAHICYTLVDAVCGHLCQPSVTLRVSGRSQS